MIHPRGSESRKLPAVFTVFSDHTSCIGDKRVRLTFGFERRKPIEFQRDSSNRCHGRNPGW